MICNKEGIPELNYMLNSDEDFLGNSSYQKYIRGGMGGPMVSRDE